MIRETLRGGVCLLQAALFVALFAFTGYAFAQGGSTAITGTVTDPQGAVVSGARITVTQLNTSVTRTDTSNGAGQFSVPSLPPATYSVSVEAAGFKGYVQNIVLLADQARDMDIRLEVGATTQRVTVETSAVQVNTISPVIGQVIEQTARMGLPALNLTYSGPAAVIRP